MWLVGLEIGPLKHKWNSHVQIHGAIKLYHRQEVMIEVYVL